MGWAMDTRGVTAAPMTHDEARGFLDEYTNNRGRWSTPNSVLDRSDPPNSGEANGPVTGKYPEKGE